MLVYAIAIVVALALPLVTRGSYSRMIAVRWRFGSVLFLGLAIQIALEYVTIPREHWHDIGFGLLVGSYVLILAFVARNLVIRGMGIVFIAIACNALVITLNQGMPFKVPAEWRGEAWTGPTVKHHPQQPDDKLRFLSDIIVLKAPFDSVISFGDLILAVGLCDVAYNVSRRPKRRRRQAANPGGRAGAAERPRSIDLTNDARTNDTPTNDTPTNDTRADRADADQEPVPTRSRSTRSRATTTRSS